MDPILKKFNERTSSGIKRKNMGILYSQVSTSVAIYSYVNGLQQQLLCTAARLIRFQRGCFCLYKIQATLIKFEKLHLYGESVVSGVINSGPLK